jgi:epsilon-lactone hydrolase
MFKLRIINAIVSALISALLVNASAALGQEASKSSVDENGTLHVGSESIPYSDLASPQARRNFIEFTRGIEILVGKSQKGELSIQEKRELLDRILAIQGVERLRKVFAVDITSVMIAGVRADVIVPAGGIAPVNKHRVLISLHGGGMQIGGRYEGQMESIPIASTGAVKVIAVDYRMAPESHHPAASEDVAKVYRELLKSYPPENIGIYGCSAGAWLTGAAVAWFQTHGLPRPGAIGMFGWGLAGDHVGDSNYYFTGGRPAVPRESFEKDPYLLDADRTDPMVSPMRDSSLLSHFPPSLLISGTRDVGLSQVVYTHSRLVDLGVKADLHIWEGAAHCSYTEPVVDPDVPENRQAWSVITRFFGEHLGRK